MPKIKYISSPASKITAAVAGCKGVGRVLKGYTSATKISESAHVELRESAARRRLENPEKMTLEELIQICIAFEVPCEDVKAKINW